MTPATGKPVVRKVIAGDDRLGREEFVVEIRDRTLCLRPLRTRRGGPQEIELTYGALYLRAMAARVEANRRRRRPRRR